MAAVGDRDAVEANHEGGATTVVDYVRECPTCRTENPPDVIRCRCGAMLAGVDLVRKGMRPPLDTNGSQASIPDIGPVTCPWDDCRQPNPPGTRTCLTCNRSLAEASAPAITVPGLIALPAALRDRYRIASLLPVTGAEAELLVVRPSDGSPERVAKIYRHGIVPKPGVQERQARVDPSHRVQVFEAGVSDGYAYEVMEYCAAGSLRELLDATRRDAAVVIAGTGSDAAVSGNTTGTHHADDATIRAIRAIVGELAEAIADVHAAGLVHRDLKPENVLVRSRDPLRLVLTDFSIASTLDATQRFTSAARTLPYASPESLSGIIDGKSDWWALGMIVIEAALGRHPFAGLSEAVILHHLATRSVDTGAIADRNVRKLVRGLLLRDPSSRWGEAEVRRWIANDPGLPEPVDARPASGFGEPYRLGEDVCETPEQLAVALSRNWRAGISDLGNGQLLAWFRNVQKDQNVVRLMIELNHERRLHVDLQLLHLILHLAPGIPPTWRGESIELQAILDRATRALASDVESEVADAVQWLSALYRFRVLEIYAKAGNAQAADIVSRWNANCDRFEGAWDRMLTLIRRREGPARDTNGAIVDIDAARLGLDAHGRPPLSSMHARLLAVAYDASWAERLRRRLQAELAPLAARCPWLVDVGDPARMDAMSLLVLEALLPEARAAVERETRAEARRREQEAGEVQERSSEFEAIVEDLCDAARGLFPTEPAMLDLNDALRRYFELAAQVRASGRSDDEWVELRNTIVRREPVVKRIQVLHDQLRRKMAITEGWLSARVGGMLLVVMLLGPRFLGGVRFLIGLAVLAVGVVAWRMVPPLFLMRDIRMLCRKLRSG